MTDLVALALRQKAEERAALEREAGYGHKVSLQGLSDEHLSWTFGADWRAEVERLDAIAEEAAARKLELNRVRREAEAVARETDRVLAEWRDEERKRATVEARKRLGLDKRKP
jgi:hypothetical protein